ncbi:MAG: hypothetical protein JXB26_16905 [Candidatus Aminicenantes bacterium]|nr:hypothetical protein [Candidatus Aminicenantes bacterium]
MSSQIEFFDRQRKKLRGGGVLGSIVFFLAWVARSALKIAETEADTIHTILMVILLGSVAWMAYFGIRLVYNENKIRKDTRLKEALYNELVLLNELKAWRIAFFSLVIFIIIAGYLVTTLPVKDPMLLIITALLVGFGSKNISTYLLDK